MPKRSPREVLDDHLRLRAAGDIEADLARNYAPDVALLCECGSERPGRDAEIGGRPEGTTPERPVRYRLNGVGGRRAATCAGRPSPTSAGSRTRPRLHSACNRTGRSGVVPSGRPPISAHQRPAVQTAALAEQGDVRRV